MFATGKDLSGRERSALGKPSSESGQTIVASIWEFQAAFGKIERYLQHQPWLTGTRFSLADISWMGDVHRLNLMGFPLTDYPTVSHWYNRVQQRPSFQTAVLDYEAPAVRHFFRVYTLWRRLRGSTVKQMTRAA